MFNQLQDRFSKIFKTIKGHGKISDKNIADAVREIRRAFLESDVNYKVVSTFIDRVKNKASGVMVLDSVTPGQQFIKIVLDELVDFLSSESDEYLLNIDSSKVPILVLAGLQGSGKTTTSAKLASFLKREFKKKPLLIGADLQRPAAQEQLKILSGKIEVDFYSEKSKTPIEVVKKGLKFAVSNNNDVIIIDTAGRLHIDQDLIKELKSIIEISQPDEILYVADSMTGQDAINSSKVFSEQCQITGTILTKMDGNSGAGAALSIKQMIGTPIKFITSGENINDIEKFDSKRISRRILGLDDVVGLVEEAQKSFDEKEVESLRKNIKENTFDFNDFLIQIEQFNKLGSFSSMSKYIPGLNKIQDLGNQEMQMKWTKAIIQSMTNKERKNPEIINGSRRIRIAKGCGKSVTDVNRLLKQFTQIKLMMKKMSNKKMGKFPFNKLNIS